MLSSSPPSVYVSVVDAVVAVVSTAPATRSVRLCVRLCFQRRRRGTEGKGKKKGRVRRTKTREGKRTGSSYVEVEVQQSLATLQAMHSAE